MKKLMITLAALFLIFWLAPSFRAAEIDTFDSDVRLIEDSIDDDTRDRMNALGISQVEDIAGGFDTEAVWRWVLVLLGESSQAPLASLMLLTGAILITSLADSYACSLRYTDMRDISGVAVSLFVASVVISPVTEMVSAAVTVMQGSAALMTVYLPVMAGILVFSGHAIASGGYYAAVVTAAQTVARLSSSVFAPLLNVSLSLALSTGICGRIRLNGLIETVSKLFKYGITFIMSVFIAVIGLNSALSSAADSVTGKAARFGLSSFIPLIGSSVAEAYGAIQSSVGILRSGIGVFVILAVLVSFVPVLVRTVLWSAALSAAKSVGEALNGSACAAVLSALLQFLSALRALLIAVMTAFIISSAVMLSAGGAS